MDKKLGDTDGKETLFEFVYDAAVSIKTADVGIIWSQPIEEKYSRETIEKKDLMLNPTIKVLLAVANTKDEHEEVVDLYMMDHEKYFIAQMASVAF